MVGVSYHWFRDGQEYQWDNLRTMLRRQLGPGEETWINVQVKAPEHAGSYLLRWDLVIEHVAWFSSRGCEFPECSIRVEP